MRICMHVCIHSSIHPPTYVFIYLPTYISIYLYHLSLSIISIEQQGRKYSLYLHIQCSFALNDQLICWGSLPGSLIQIFILEGFEPLADLPVWGCNSLPLRCYYFRSYFFPLSLFNSNPILPCYSGSASPAEIQYLFG